MREYTSSHFNLAKIVLFDIISFCYFLLAHFLRLSGFADLKVMEFT